MLRRLTSSLLPLTARQDGVLTVEQLARAGVSPSGIRALVVRGGWSSPVRGVLAQPEPADPSRASVRAALLGCPVAVICKRTAARLLGLQGLPLWHPDEVPQLLLPANLKRAQRKGMRLSWGELRDAELVRLGGVPTTSALRTLGDLAALPRETLVCLLDSALSQRICSLQDLGEVPRLAVALALADSRAESPLETRLRLLLVASGLAPEVAQYVVRDENGIVLARLDFAWPSRRLAVEADGRWVHEREDALFHDRYRQNELVLQGWTVLRFTWADVTKRTAYVVAQVRHALAA